MTRILKYDPTTNEEARKKESQQLDSIRCNALSRTKAYQEKMMHVYNKGIQPRDLQVERI